MEAAVRRSESGGVAGGHVSAKRVTAHGNPRGPLQFDPIGSSPWPPACETVKAQQWLRLSCLRVALRVAAILRGGGGLRRLGFRSEESHCEQFCASWCG